MKQKCKFAFNVVLLLCTGYLSAQDSTVSGSLSGSVMDEDTGRGLEGVSVMVNTSEHHVSTDAFGQYSLENVPSGTANVRFFKARYEVLEVSEVVIPGGQARELNVTLSSRPEATSETAGEAGNIFELSALSVTASQVENRDVELISIRRQSLANVNAISSEAMARFAAGDAAEALARIPGVSIADGKFAVVRGLNDRYNNTRLNGVVLPSPDPEKQAVQLDLFPAELIDNIVVSKTFTPNLPGDTSGGSVNIRTTYQPLNRHISFSFGVEASQSAHAADFYPGYNDGGNSDLWAYGSKDRAAPGENTFADFHLSDRSAPLAYDFSVSYGNVLKVMNLDLGVFFALNYDQSVGYQVGFTENRSASRYNVVNRFGQIIETPGDLSHGEMNGTYGKSDVCQSDFEVALAGIAGLSYKVSKNHDVTFTLYYTRTGNDTARGEYNSYFAPGLNLLGASNFNLATTPPERLNEPFVAENVGRRSEMLNSEYIYYTERDLKNLSLSGNSYFGDSSDLQVSWSLVRSDTSQNEPDLRDSTYLTRWNADLTARDPNYFDSRNSSDFAPQLRRVWRDIQETQDAAALDIVYHLPFFKGRKMELGAGGAYTSNERTAVQTNLFYSLDGITGASKSEYWENFHLSGGGAPGSTPSGAEGSRQIKATYGYLTLPVLERLRLSAGARFETTRHNVSGDGKYGAYTPIDYYNSLIPGTSGSGAIRNWQFLGMDSPDPSGSIDREDWMPSASLVYEITPSMSIRASHSRTVARPSFRETMPYYSLDVDSGGNLIIGNPDLQMSRVENWDLRWEWFHGENEQDLVAVSVFTKTIANPIEKQILYHVDSRRFVETWRNNDGEADLRGIELELSQNLSVFSSVLEAFTLTLNLTYIDAEVPLEEDIRVLYAGGQASLNNPNRGGGYETLEDVPLSRRLFDQPEWITSADITYRNEGIGLQVTLAYYFISSVMSGAGNVSPDFSTYDRYDASYQQLDLVIKKTFGERWKLGFAVENLTDTARGTVYGDDLKQKIWQNYYKLGRKFSLSATYTF